MSRSKVERIARALRAAYGEPDLAGEARRPVLDQLIHTLLSQKTTSASCRLAFERLKAIGDWDTVARAGVSAVVEAIRPAGLAEQKALWILTALERATERFGAPSLEPLREWPDGEVVAYLSTFPGAGPKTRACVLLFALGRQALPVDTHVYRVTRRLGLLAPEVPIARAQVELESLVPPRLRGLFHVGLYEHGRRVCRSQRPHCANCTLSDLCPASRAPV
jgi:endonuclease-3